MKSFRFPEWSRVARWYIFKTKNPNLGKFRRELGMEKVGKLYGYLEYITAIWYILQPFGIFYGHLVFFPRFGTLCQ
jgi:hypothetical protein